MTPPDLPPRVRVVTVNYDGGPLTVECVDRLHETRWPRDRLELVLVDNDSHDGVAELVRHRWPDVHVIESGVNLGFAGGSNLGIGSLEGVDYVALINNDVAVEHDWLAPLVDALETDPSVGAASPKIRFASRFVEVELSVSTSRPGRGDRRDLGARVVGIDVAGRDVLGAVQWWRGFWGPEAQPAAEPAMQWTAGDAVLRVPVALDEGAPSMLRICLVGKAAGSVRIRAGGPALTAALTTEPTWHDVVVGGEPVEVINNAGSVLTPDGYGADRGYLEPDDGRFDLPTDVFAWCGAAVVLSARYLTDVGLLDDRLFLYYEDLELSWRGRDRGWRYRYVPKSVVRHVHSAATGEHSSLARYQNERNHLLVLARHAPATETLRAAGRSLLITASYARRDVISPMLHGERPRSEIVRDRARAFLGFLRLLPAMARERNRVGDSDRMTARG